VRKFLVFFWSVVSILALVVFLPFWLVFLLADFLFGLVSGKKSKFWGLWSDEYEDSFR